MKKAIGLGFLTLLAVVALGAAPEAPPSAVGYYQQALQAYLEGDYDQAILLDTKSLQVDSSFAKAKALLSVLVSEKETAGKTVIWIGGRPALVDKKEPTAAPAPIVQREVIRTERVDQAKLRELESRIQTVALLLEKGTAAQYQELASAQAQLNHRLDGMSKGFGDPWALLALLISLLALGLSIRANRRKTRETGRHSERRAAAEEIGKVVNLR